MVTGTPPSLYEILQGATPVKSTVSVADCPLQMVVVPLNAAVGRSSTVTKALPLKSAPIDVHLLSLVVISVYVFVEEGDTAKVYGLALMLLTVTGVTPSVYVKLQEAEPVSATVSVAD